MTDEAHDDLVARSEARVGVTLKEKWHLDGLLGMGGMASVYAATHRNGKRVAVKVLHPELSMNAAVRQRFLREGYVANSVKHAGATSVDDDDVAEDGCAFLVMELLDGETLEARWERKGRHIEETEVLSLMDQVLDTLIAAHEKGIVHRDLKPENLFLTHGGQVKVLDFGIARVKELSASGSHTQTGSPMGTPAFMPPEQARGLWTEVDQASDIWAIGATMFSLLTGRLVHPSATVNEALVYAVTRHAPSVGSVGVPIHPDVAALVDRALAYDKADRWPSAQTMQDALREAYVAITNKPITLPGGIEDDIPARRFVRATSAAPQGVTAMGGVVAIESGVEARHRGLPQKLRSPVVLAACAFVVGTIVFGLFRHAAATRRAETPSEPTFASAPQTAANALPNATSTNEVAPVVPLERLPIALASGALLGGKSPPRTNPAPPRAAAVASAAPTGARTESKPASLIGDPFATRH